MYFLHFILCLYQCCFFIHQYLYIILINNAPALKSFVQIVEGVKMSLIVIHTTLKPLHLIFTTFNLLLRFFFINYCMIQIDLGDPNIILQLFYLNDLIIIFRLQECPLTVNFMELFFKICNLFAELFNSDVPIFFDDIYLQLVPFNEVQLFLQLFNRSCLSFNLCALILYLNFSIFENTLGVLKALL